MERAVITKALAHAVDVHCNTHFYEALLNAFVAELELRGIALVIANDKQDRCVLDLEERKAAGLAIMQAREVFMRPTASKELHQRWARSANNQGEWMTYVGTMITGLESQGIVFVVVDQALREKYAEHKPAPATIRALCQQAIEGTEGNSAEAAIAICCALEKRMGLGGNGWWDNDPELQALLWGEVRY